jgi:hypothetical protein
MKVFMVSIAKNLPARIIALRMEIVSKVNVYAKVVGVAKVAI